MLTFLLEQSKNSVKKEYRSRTFLLFLGAICFLTIYSISVIIPTYTSSLLEENRLTQEVQHINLGASNCTGDKTNCIDPTLQIKATNILLKVLKDENRAFVSVPLLEILSNRNNGIKISSIRYLGETDGQYNFSISGLAESRDDLLAFSGDLKKDTRFSGINLPISDFVKSVDISFVLTIKVKK